VDDAVDLPDDQLRLVVAAIYVAAGVTAAARRAEALLRDGLALVLQRAGAEVLATVGDGARLEEEAAGSATSSRAASIPGTAR
jgi:hypothetical protein